MYKTNKVSQTKSFRRMAFRVICLAMVTVLFSSLLPHHHHGHEACITYEVCEMDGSWNDEHTSHHCGHDGSELPKGGDTCPFSIQDFVKPSLQYTLQGFVGHVNLTFLINEYFYQTILPAEGTTIHRTHRNEAIHGVDDYAFHSFRAPPFC